MTEPENKVYPPYFPALTGVRAVAVYLVFLHHYNPFSVSKFGPWLSQLVREFHIGVSIFFVLSGFLITIRYFNSEAAKFTWRSYLVNRVARVYPMYFLITTLTFMVAMAQPPANQAWAVYVMNITFLRGFFDDIKFSLVSQGWSLTVEECFYFLAPIIFYGVRKSKWALALAPLSFLLVGCLLVRVGQSVNASGFFKSYDFMLIYTFFGRCVEFFCGVALAIHFKPGPKTGRGFTYGSLGLMVLIVIGLSRLGTDEQPGIQSAAGVFINNFILPLSIGGLFFGLTHEETWLRELLSSRVFVLLGKASYTFYLIHVGVISIWLDGWVKGNLFGLFLLLNLAAVGLWWLLEEPLNRAIKRI